MTRQVVMGILALLVLSLAACQTPPQTPLAAGTGQLLSERSQVFFQKRGQAAEEVVVNDIRAAGAGDGMWTQSRGRALLKFRDLWARLYDDTAFHAADVTPSSIKATLGSGAVLIGEPSQSPERVEIIAGTPPRVRVVLAGTLVMVAYMPAQQVVLVRTFDGKVDVSVLASGQSVQSGGDGAEWVLVGPDGRIETPSQDDVRALARRVGIWDQYHEIEVDATGFGPPASRIPAERVTMTFVEKAAVPPTRVDESEIFPVGTKPVPVADVYADRMVSFMPGSPSNPDLGNAEAALGPPDFSESALTGFLSLGVGGSVTVEFVNNVVADGPGFDIEIVGDPSDDEQWMAEASADCVSYKSFGRVRERALLDLAKVGLVSARCVRLTDDGDPSGGVSPGAELDAVVAVNSAAPGQVRPLPVQPTRFTTARPPTLAPSNRKPASIPTPFVACGPEHTVIAREDCAVLRWDIQNAKAVYLDGAGVGGRDERRVCPSETHIYELRIVTDASDKSCRMVVEVRTPSKPVITDIRTSDIVSIGGLREPECGSSKVAVSARVTSPHRLAKVQMWRSDLATWSEMASQGADLYVSSQNFKAGNEFRVRAEDEFGDTTETDTLPSPCMRVGTVANRLSGKCIDVRGSPAMDNEAPLQLWDCEDNWSPAQTDQRWGMTSDGFIQNALSGKCIDVKGGPAVDNGSPLQLWDCEFGSPSTQTDQKWELTADGFIRNQLSGKCIDVMNSSGIDYEAVPGVKNQAALQLWDCEFSQPAAATDQRWQWR